MPECRIASLNEAFGHDNAIRFATGNGGLEKLDLAYGEASARIYLQGAQVTRYRPLAGVDALWMSDSAVYRRGGALRGGIPLCWPWFGAAAAGAERPQHGYARNTEFTVLSTSADAAGTAITLTLDPAQAPCPEWRNKLQLEIEIRLSGSLWLEMRSRNLANQPLTLGNALHGYFAISDRGKISIPALTGLTYLDKPHGYREQRQSRAIRLEGEIDRIYHAAPAVVELQDSGRRLCTSIRCWGNNDLVIWNPGAQKARAMADFDASGFHRMVCIEPANALEHSVVLQPGESHRLGQCITLTGSA